MLPAMRSCMLTVAVAALLGCGKPDEVVKTKAPDKQSEKSEIASKPAQDAPATETSVKESLVGGSDQERILGSWRSTRFEQNGTADPGGSGGKAAFLKDQLWLHGLPVSYTLDPSQNPKHITGVIPGIYRLNGDSLTICFATSNEGPRPTDFTTSKNDRRQLIDFTRLAPFDPNTPDADFDSSLKQTISDAILQLQAGRIADFLQDHVLPGRANSPQGEQLKEIVEHLSLQKEAYIATFQVLPKIAPAMNAAHTQATFDLTTIHIEGGLHFANIKFAKIAGRWYIQNR